MLDFQFHKQGLDFGLVAAANLVDRSVQAVHDIGEPPEIAGITRHPGLRSGLDEAFESVSDFAQRFEARHSRAALERVQGTHHLGIRRVSERRGLPFVESAFDNRQQLLGF